MATKLFKQNTRHYRYGICFSRTGPIRKIIVTGFLFLAFSSAFAQDAESYYKKGYEKEIAEKFEEAIKFFDKAIAIKEDYTLAWLDRGYCKSSLGLFKEAIADYSQVIKIDPTYKDGWYNRGLDKYDLGDYRGSLADLTTAIALDPNDGESYFNRGVALEALHKKDSACADFKKSLDLGFAEAKESVDYCNGKPNNESGLNNIILLDTADGSVRLVAQGPSMQAVGRDTSYGLAFIVLPPGTGAFDSNINYNEILKQDPSASIDVDLKNGKTLHMKLVLTGENKSEKKPLLFMGVFDQADKKLLIENDLKKINIYSGKSQYKYVIKDAYTDKIKGLFQTPAAK